MRISSCPRHLSGTVGSSLASADGRDPYVALRQPLAKPMGQALPFPEILIELAHRVGNGMERYFRFGRMEHYIEAMIRRIPKLVDAGGIDLLMG